VRNRKISKLWRLFGGVDYLLFNQLADLCDVLDERRVDGELEMFVLFLSVKNKIIVFFMLLTFGMM